MKTQLAGLAIATFLITSCEKNKTEPKIDDSSIKNPSKEIQAPAIAEHVPTVRSTIPSHNSPVTPEMIRSAGDDSGDSSWQTLSAEQKIEKFRTKGIIRMPKDISDELIANAVSAGAPEVQV
jgi:hypothetical protein